jgi:cAMP phosphodiesterase
MNLEENELYILKHLKKQKQFSEFCDGNQKVRSYLITHAHVHSVVIITRKAMTKSGM